jgi:hypothetical protein
MSTPDTQHLRRFLLHQLPQEQARQLEERLMLEEGFVAALSEAEHDLLEDYSRERLTPEERAEVEKYLLATPRDRQRLEITRGLIRLQASRGATHSPQRPARSTRKAFPHPFSRWSALVGALAAACLLAIILRFVVPRGGIQHGSGAVQTVVLLADNERGSQSRLIEIKPGITALKVQVEIPGDAAGSGSTYRLSVSGPGEPHPYQAERLAAQVAGAYSYVEAIVPVSAFDTPSRRVVVSISRQPSLPGAPVYTWQLEVRRR